MPSADVSIDLQIHLATFIKHSGPSVSCSFTGWHDNVDSLVKAMAALGRYICTQKQKSTS